MLNQITLMGRLTKDPELRTTQSGIAVASFTVACERDAGEKDKRETDFVDCVAWRQTAEFISKYFRKGSMILTVGRLQSRKWEDREGNKRTAWEIVADKAYFAGDKAKDTDGGMTQQQRLATLRESDEYEDGQLPF